MIDDITEEAIDKFGVTQDDVQVDLYYTASGTLQIDNPNGFTNEEIENKIQDAIANTLGIHPKNVEVTYDENTGEATYAIVSDDFDNLEDNVEILKLDDFVNSKDVSSMKQEGATQSLAQEMNQDKTFNKILNIS